MARHAGLKSYAAVLPDAVLGSLPLELTAMAPKVSLEVDELDHRLFVLTGGRVTRV